MSSLLIHSPKAGSTAAKLKSFSHSLNKSFSIAKRWTLEKVGAREQSQDPPELTSLITAFQQDKAELEELRAKITHLITTEKTLLDADLAFAQTLDDLHLPELPPSDDAPPPPAVPSSSSPSSLPPFTPQTFSSYSSHLHSLHTTYLTSLSSTLLDPLDQLLDNDVNLLSTITKQLPLLRLDHAAKADALQSAEKAGKGVEEAVVAEKESREIWEAQVEVIEKISLEVHQKKGEVVRAIAEGYVRVTKGWYEEMGGVVGRAWEVREVGGVENEKMQDVTRTERVEAVVENVGHSVGVIGEKLIDSVVGVEK